MSYCTLCASHLGDVNMDGTLIGEQPGHFNEEYKPKGFETRQFFLSPSIRYAGKNVYAKTFR